ncbi:hypothetical protein ABZP36_009566 [Zizania latifolia]
MAGGGAEAAVAAALLGAKPDEPRRNTFAFACATLASMTTVLMGYSKLLSCRGVQGGSRQASMSSSSWCCL